MNHKKHATELHEEHKEMLNKISFYKDELKVMKNRLAEVVSKNTAKDILTSAEHFQNQFIIQQENLDTLQHKVNEHENFVQREITLHPVASDRQLFADSPQMRDEIQSFENVFTEMRKEFNTFLSKIM